MDRYIPVQSPFLLSRTADLCLEVSLVHDPGHGSQMAAVTDQQNPTPFEVEQLSLDNLD